MEQRNDPSEELAGKSEPETSVVRRDWSDGVSPSHSVAEAVAEVTGIEPADMQPLYEVIDPEALDQLIESTRGRSRRFPEGRVTFRFEGCEVAVHADGRTVVSPVGNQP